MSSYGVEVRVAAQVRVRNDLKTVLDERRYPDLMEVDFARGTGPLDHNTFGNGPHKCVGALLARAEVQVFLDEFVGRMPEFRLDPGRQPVEHCGSVPGFSALYLRWD